MYQKNVFGNVPPQYSWLCALKNASESAYNAFMQSKGRKIFNGGSGKNMNRMINDHAMTLDSQNAQAISYITNNLEALQSEVEEILYSEFRLDDYFPMETSIPEGAQSYAYRVTNEFGEAGFIENSGTNARRAQTTLQLVPYALKVGGIVPTWTLDDLRSAAFSGISLDSDTIRAGSRSCMQHIERVGLGLSSQDVINTDPVFEGLLNMSQVPVITATTPWDENTTPNTVIDEINQYIASIVEQSNDIFGRVIKTTMAIYGSDQLRAFLLKPRADAANTTIWSFLEASNYWTDYTGGQRLEFRSVTELRNAGDGGTQRILFGYPNAKEVWEMGQSISPRVLNINPNNFVIEAPMEYKISGLNVKRPGGMLYVDNVFTPSVSLINASKKSGAAKFMQQRKIKKMSEKALEKSAMAAAVSAAENLVESAAKDAAEAAIEKLLADCKDVSDAVKAEVKNEALKAAKKAAKNLDKKQ